MHERPLAERLISYDTSTPDGLRAAAGFVKGWLQSHEIDARDRDHAGLPVILADVGAPESAGAPTVILHGHLDVVPAHAEQFSPRVEGDRLIGRGAYDMKGALAAMLCVVVEAARGRAVRLRFVCVPDEESEDIEHCSTAVLAREGLSADFAITGEPTDLHIGVEAKGVLAMRLRVSGKAAHGSTPWLGDNAVLKAVDVFRAIESLPFSRESSELFDRPSINLGRILGGDALNKVPDACMIDIDVRYLPEQEPGEILAAVRALPDVEVLRTFVRVPAHVPRTDPYVRTLRGAVGRSTRGDVLSVGRDGASDAVSFLEAGIPAVEFGPCGAGHHGPDEWVSLSSLRRYREALGAFVAALPGAVAGPSLRAVPGGLR
ncbi:MAG TPA: M20/M25/M40 family metallo-hydrolase [Solirubrobacteraceae bacterium]|jgi:succinyl-diaminopimelate desuccinylase|nr:M20/M25/M40 family metallo-hydrolase [Solirubrobacteraceae bacterium]